jgi:hypothetical protein
MKKRQKNNGLTVVTHTKVPGQPVRAQVERLPAIPSSIPAEVLDGPRGAYCRCPRCGSTARCFGLAENRQIVAAWCGSCKRFFPARRMEDSTNLA